MHRIIERIVTVVTTTTWRISWKPDTPHPDHPTGTDPINLPIPEHLASTLPITNHNSQEIEATNIDQAEKKN